MWRKTHNKEPHNLCTSPNITRLVAFKEKEHCDRHGETINTYTIFVGIPEGKQDPG
jgi:hypothetical protein